MTTLNSSLSSDRSALRGLGPLFPIVFCGYLALGLPIPVIALVVHDRLGFDAIVVGWVIGIQSLATVLTRSFAGRLSDGRGPKLSTCIGLPLAGPRRCCVSLVGSSVRYPESLAGLSFAGACSARARGKPVPDRHHGLGSRAARARPHRARHRLAGDRDLRRSRGRSPLGLVIMARFGFAAVASTAMVVPLIGLAIATFVPAERAIAGRRVPFARVIGLVWRQGIGLMLAGMPFAALTAFISLDYAARGWAGAGLALSGFGAGYIVMRLFFAHWPDRFGGVPVAVGSLLVEGLGQVVIWASPNAASALLGATLTGIGFSLVFPGAWGRGRQARAASEPRLGGRRLRGVPRCVAGPYRSRGGSRGGGERLSFGLPGGRLGLPCRGRGPDRVQPQHSLGRRARLMRSSIALRRTVARSGPRGCRRDPRKR